MLHPYPVFFRTDVMHHFEVLSLSRYCNDLLRLAFEKSSYVASTQRATSGVTQVDQELNVLEQ